MATIKRSVWGWSAYDRHGDLIASTDIIDDLEAYLRSLGVDFMYG